MPWVTERVGGLPDRRVHARIGEKYVVRYDRAGKWWLEEWAFGERRRVTIAEAVEFVVESRGKPDTFIYFGIPGGSTFDRKVRQALIDAHLDCARAADDDHADDE